MQVKKYVFQESTQHTGAGTVYTEWMNVGISSEMRLFLELTAQGAYTDETLNITMQTRSINENPHNDVSFNEVGNVTASLPHYDSINAYSFGSLVRFKIVKAGTGVDYTFSITGYGKRD